MHRVFRKCHDRCPCSDLVNSLKIAQGGNSHPRVEIAEDCHDMDLTSADRFGALNCNLGSNGSISFY
jgi:hypothetical protein